MCVYKRVGEKEREKENELFDVTCKSSFKAKSQTENLPLLTVFPC